MAAADVEKFYLALAAHEQHVHSADIKPLHLTYEEALGIFNRDNDHLRFLLFVKALPFELLDHFARVGDDAAKTTIAGKYPLLPETYAYLAQQCESVRVRLCSNKALPDRIARALADDPNPFVREIYRRAPQRCKAR